MISRSQQHALSGNLCGFLVRRPAAAVLRHFTLAVVPRVLAGGSGADGAMTRNDSGWSSAAGSE
jgi:hypothetical protein